MKFVLCSDSVYANLYERKAYKYVRVNDHRDLVGYHNIQVIVHDHWEDDLNDDRVDYLAQQLEALADFGYIQISYVDDDGWVDNYEAPSISPLKTPQMDFLHERGLGYREPPKSPQDGSGAVVAYEDDDSGCDSGACAI
jgi:hypothetical protein